MTRRFLSVALAVSVLLSSTSWQLNLHLCGGSVVNWALWSKADGCPREKKPAPVCGRHRGLSRKKCCAERSIAVHGLEHQCAAWADAAPTRPLPFDWNAPPALPDGRVSVAGPALAHPPHWLNDKPPPLKGDAQAVLQVFRI